MERVSDRTFHLLMGAFGASFLVFVISLVACFWDRLWAIVAIVSLAVFLGLLALLGWERGNQHIVADR